MTDAPLAEAKPTQPLLLALRRSPPKFIVNPSLS